MQDIQMAYSRSTRENNEKKRNYRQTVKLSSNEAEAAKIGCDKRGHSICDVMRFCMLKRSFKALNRPSMYISLWILVRITALNHLNMGRIIADGQLNLLR